MLRQFGGDGLWDAAAGQLLGIARELHFRQDDVLYRAEEPARHLYFIIAGVIRSEDDASEPWIIDAPGLVGFFDAELRRPHCRTAIAHVDTHTFVVRADDYFDIMQGNITVVINRIGILASLAVKVGQQVNHCLLLQHESHANLAVVALRPPTVDRRDRELNRFERLLMLRLCPMFANCGMQALHRLAAMMRQRMLCAGEQLYAAGDTADTLYIVVQGRVDLHDNENTIVVQSVMPEPLGAYLSIGVASRSYNVIVVTHVRLLFIATNDLFDVMEDHFDAAHAVLAYQITWMERLRIVGLARSEDSSRELNAHE